LTGHYSARGAAVGGRTIKTGQSRWFVGYKKHTLRLWLSHYTEHVLLVPLVSWLAAGNRGDALFLPPSVRYCARHLDWVPDLVVGDMGYINQAAQRDLRQHWNVGVLTRLRPDMKLIEPFEPGPVVVCAQGQRLEWLGYEARDHLHWFGVRERAPRTCRRLQLCQRALKTSHFESGIAQRAGNAARVRDVSTQREPAIFHRRAGGQRLVGAQNRPRTERPSGDGGAVFVPGADFKTSHSARRVAPGV
jgi:hypothetical protein